MPLPHKTAGPSPSASEPQPHEAYWSQLRLDLLWAYEAVKGAGDSGLTEPHAPGNAWVVLEGASTVEQGGRRVEIREGEWIALAPEARRQVFAPGTRILSVGFLARWPNGTDLIRIPQATVLDHPETDRLTRRARRIAEVIDEICAQTCDWHEARHWKDHLSLCQHLELKSAFRSWLATFAQVAASYDAIVQRWQGIDPRIPDLMTDLEARSGTEPLDWPAVETRIGLSRRRIDQLFKVETGKTLKAYHEELQLRALRRELLDGHAQIKEIAYRAGFHQTSSFTRWFHRRTGMTPSEFRAAHLSSDDAQDASDG